MPFLVPFNALKGLDSRFFASKFMCPYENMLSFEVFMPHEMLENHINLLFVLIEYESSCL